MSVDNEAPKAASQDDRGLLPYPEDDGPTFSSAEFEGSLEVFDEFCRPRRPTGLLSESARLGNARDLRPLFLSPEEVNGDSIHAAIESTAGDTVFPGVTPLVEITNTGEKLKAQFNRILLLSRELRNRHVLCVGQTGCGKTTRIVHPLLRSDIVDDERTVIVIDVKGELTPVVRHLTRDYRSEEPLILNFRDSDRSLGWNPLETVVTAGDAFELAYCICNASETSYASADSAFFRNSAIDLLTSIFLVLKAEDRATIAHALEVVDMSVRDMKSLSSKHVNVTGFRRFAEYAETGSHNAETVLADLRMRLSLWRDERIVLTTSTNEVDLNTLGRSPKVVILQVNEEDVDSLRPLTNSFLTLAIAALLRTARESRGNTLPIPVSIFVEEFASAVGRIPGIEKRLNTVRQRGVAFVASVQSIRQVYAEYMLAADGVLAGFATKLFFADLVIEDAEFVSRNVGKSVFLDEEMATIESVESGAFGDADEASTDEAAGMFGDRSRTRTTTTRTVERALLHPNEIIRSPKSRLCGRAVTCLIPSFPPFQAFFTPSYLLRGFAQTIKECSNENGFGPVRRVPLEVPKPISREQSGAGHVSAWSPDGTPPWVSETRGWTDDAVRERLNQVKKGLDWENTTGSARKWWEAFEIENRSRVNLVLRLAEELLHRKATVTEFFLAHVYSHTDNIQANLSYLDYTRLKKEEEKKKKEAAAKALQNGIPRAESSSPTTSKDELPSDAGPEPVLPGE